MENLFDGVREFNANDFQTHRDLFSRLGREQSPHTLFIGCADSRIVPNLITRALPGELFVVRNIANIVPYYRETEEFVATTSCIEYAVNVLNVRNIIVCGHSNCGGCNALFKTDAELASIPHTKKWLELARRVKDRIAAEGIIDGEEREWRAEQMNVVEQMNHLVTYPYIKERYRNGELNIFGWYYIIETGEVYNYDRADRTFRKIE
jgi:carbonic anhydrase